MGLQKVPISGKGDRNQSTHLQGWGRVERGTMGFVSVDPQQVKDEG